MRRNTFHLTFFSACLATLLIQMAWVGTSHAVDAKDNYQWYCGQCHGNDGKGAGANAKPATLGLNLPEMAVAPRNHASAKDMETLSDNDLFQAIKGGGVAVSKSALMPPFGKTMSEGEMKDLVKYLRELCKCKGK